ncbi:MAG: winged helix-turn-helix domain-containing protein [Alcanivoracaceae bacterium]|nr:winged helix-turn-helix domain-containing protein [Alcanivoracaceae bacterium]
MLYLFLGFTLDSTKKELYHQSKKVDLTKQNYQLLYFFLQNPRIVVDKDKLIKEVWNDRVVADNTIDQSIYKLKKVLTQVCNGQYFETIYGQGIKFLPEVECIENTHKMSKAPNNISKIKYSIIVLLTLLIISIFLWINQNTANVTNKTQISNKSLLFIPNTIDKGVENDWLTESSGSIIEKYLSLSNKVKLKNYQDKPENLNTKQYLDTQWKLYPDLNVIISDISLEDNLFSIDLNLKNKKQQLITQSFSDENLTRAINKSTKWITQQVGETDANITAITENPHVLELYMRGLASLAKKDFDQSIGYFEMCLKQNPDYHLAALELSKLMDRRGNQIKALALLDTIRAVNTNNIISIEAENIRGGILLRQGKPDETQTVYQDILNKYDYKDYSILANTQYKLALLYHKQSKNNEALNELTVLEDRINHSQNIELLAEIYQFKCSLLLRMARTQEAVIFGKKSLALYTQTGNLTGLARSHSVISRVLIHQAKYPQAIEHLNQALSITKSLDYKFGIGAVLNEMIGLLISQGELKKAWTLTQEMQQIALDIDFTAMLLASKHYIINIAIIQNKWQTAQLYLTEHQQLAKASNNKRAIIENIMSQLDLDLSQQKADNILINIEKTQTHIDESNETRMQTQTNTLLSRYYLLTHQQNKALLLLKSSLLLAKDSDDGEAIIKINNLLGQIYLDNNQPNKVLTLIENYKQSAIDPYLLLKSKAYAQLKQLTKAIEYAVTYKRTVNELWESKDEEYLSSIINQKRQEK